MNLPQDGIKLHRGNFTAIGQQIQPYLEDGKCFRMVLKPWREKRSLSQNALSHMWYSEISEYLISRGKSFATAAWVKEALKHTYLGYETKDLVDVVTGEMRIPLYSITDWHRSPISDSHPFDQPGT
ncbi:DLP12 prophage; DNA base-flipping protein [Escherichia coli]|nr:DLP12 prophage; DNA base-flipping protein [Escherichia coli]